MQITSAQLHKHNTSTINTTSGKVYTLQIGQDMPVQLTYL
jgi:hypothetical protein